MNQTKLTSANFGFKGWIVILYVMLSYFVPTCVGSAWQMAGNIWAGMYGWNVNTLVSMLTIGNLLAVITIFVSVALSRKFSPRIMCFVSVIVYLILIALVGFIHSFTAVCLIVVFATPIGATWMFGLNPVIVANWFPRKRAIAMGIVTIGIPLGSGLTSRIVLAANAAFGPRLMFMPYVILGIVALLLLLIVVRDNPEEAGCRPDNDHSVTKEDAARMLQQGKAAAQDSSWTTRRLLKTAAVWKIGIAMGLLNLISGGAMTNMITRLLGLGYPQASAANMMLVAAFSAIVGSYLMGLFDAKFGTKRAIQAVTIFGILSMILNLLASPLSVVLSLIALGVCMGGASNFAVSITITYWGRFHFAKAYAVIQPIIQIFGALGMAYVAQVSSRASYFAAYGGMIIMCVVAFLLITSLKMTDQADDLS